MDASSSPSSPTTCHGPAAADDEPLHSNRESNTVTAPCLYVDRSPMDSHVHSRNSSPATSPSPPSSPNTRARPRILASSYRFTSNTRFIISMLVLVSFASLAIILDSFTNHQRDVSGCQEIYMRPTYIRQTGFDSEMTRFAGKYALYLYREKDVDLSDQPSGVPVLFVPGHAGSYKQVRAIAAEAAFHYYQLYAQHPEIHEQGMRNLDFFTVDFHEEFSALHGQSLLEQAEYLNDAIDYILKIYKSDKYPDPASVMIIGHSMGGVVAKTMFMLNNYQPGTINTIITLSTPHVLPPAPFDWKISKIYDDMHQFWIDGYNLRGDDTTTARSLRDVTMISIAGGTLDNTVCSDSANVGAFLPATHGFTVFTTAIPRVWTGMDHLEILSCKQLVHVLVKAMLDIVDARRSSQVKSVSERMSIMKRAFLSGLEDRGSEPISLGSLMYFDHVSYLDIDERLVIQGERSIKGNHVTLLPAFGSNNDAFAILTDQALDEARGRFSLYLCNRHDGHSGGVACKSADTLVAPVPASTPHDRYPFSGNTFSFASIEFGQMDGHGWIGIADNGDSDGFLIAEPFSTTENAYRVDQSMSSIAMLGAHVKVNASLFTRIHIPAIENPMLAYHLTLTRQCNDLGLFAPFLRQSISTMHESKFYVNVGNGPTDFTLHGRTAFSSMTISTADVDHQGFLLQMWMDPTTCQEPIHVDIAIDWYGSAGRLGFRNGIMLASFTFIIVILVLAGQIECYNRTGIFPHFGQGLSFYIRRILPVIMLAVGLCSIYQCSIYDGHDFGLDIPWEHVLDGNTDPFFWWLPLAGLVVSSGTVCFIWVVVDRLLLLCAYVLSGTFGTQRVLTWSSHPTETKQQRFQRRAITTVILFVLVATCIPYQFVFVVAFLVHTVNCIRSLVRSWSSPSRVNRYHYMQSLLLLFVTLLPFNLPILVVWIRNLSVHWFVPFSSDHNVFAIAPFILYVELLTGHRKMLPRHEGVWRWATRGLFCMVVAYAFLYGIKYAHSLYFLANHMMAWFLVLHVRDSHYGRMAWRYAANHIWHPFLSKKHS
ncbi:hypothetical protein O0I10_007613 [Lichtheimia ornata]|uniref:GPI inositol-deacylase n=1 Tax=Lichtheimia ornata TaxID=688661 RepID=A0AAD7XW75_9FUNG|nr:uncharacterized protein O0I10_007613 [Lichtheimia ornata]KAJ8656765.1 hypothetical protein O0I10_007613 [Lichtheimia ornata]